MSINACSLVFSSNVTREQFLGLSQDKPWFLTYFAGRFTYLDFFLSSTYHAGAKKQLLVSRKHADLVHSCMEHGWTEDAWQVLPFFEEEGEAPFDKQMLTALKNELSPWVFFGQVDHPIYFDGAEFVASIPKRKKVIIPVIDKRQPPFVLVEKGVLLDLLTQAVKKKVPTRVVLDEVLKVLKKHSKAVKVEARGYYREIKTLDKFIAANFEVLRKAPFFNELFVKVPIQSVVSEKGQAVIERGASFCDSFVGDRSSIHGNVIRSIIFPDVVIGKQAEIRDSIVFPRIVIGANAKITKALIDEGVDLAQSERAHIGIGSSIGRENGIQPNQTVPDSLASGYSYVAKGVMIPRGVSIGANCYVASGIGKMNFRRVKNISDGRSLVPSK